MIVLAGVLVLGGGACVVLGALVAIGASADADSPAASATASATQSSPSSSSSTTTAPAVAGDDEPASDSDEPSEEPSPSPSPSPSATTAKPAGTAANGATWFCSASGSARVCGFAGACNYQMMFGNGFGKDRFLASQQAKNACEAQARAKGTSTVCVVQCSLR